MDQTLLSCICFLNVPEWKKNGFCNVRDTNGDISLLLGQFHILHCIDGDDDDEDVVDNDDDFIIISFSLYLYRHNKTRWCYQQS